MRYTRFGRSIRSALSARTQSSNAAGSRLRRVARSPIVSPSTHPPPPAPPSPLPECRRPPPLLRRRERGVRTRAGVGDGEGATSFERRRGKRAPLKNSRAGNIAMSWGRIARRSHSGLYERSSVRSRELTASARSVPILATALFDKSSVSRLVIVKDVRGSESNCEQDSREM